MRVLGRITMASLAEELQKIYMSLQSPALKTRMMREVKKLINQYDKDSLLVGGYENDRGKRDEDRRV